MPGGGSERRVCFRRHMRLLLGVVSVCRLDSALGPTSCSLACFCYNLVMQIGCEDQTNVMMYVTMPDEP